MKRELSLSDLGKRVNYSKSHLSKVESGVKRPSITLARRCDQALAAGGALSSLVAARTETAIPEPGPSGNVWTIQLTSEGRCQFAVNGQDPAQPAGALTWMGWTIARPVDAAKTTMACLPFFRRWFDDIRRFGQTAPPSAVARILIGMTNVVRSLAVAESSVHQAKALRLASRFAEYSGWMAQEMGDESAAAWWTAYAVELAVAGGDFELETYALVRRAELAMYRGDPITTVMLSQQAQTRCGSARVRSFAAQREAQGHAIAGDDSACYRALERAEALAAAASDDGEPALGTTTMTDPIAFVTGWCMHDLGRPAEAVEILSRELRTIPTDALRTRARYEARLALALARGGSIEQACGVVQPSLAHAHVIDSATVRHDLRLFSRELSRHRRYGAVQDILPSLTLALRANTV